MDYEELLREYIKLYVLVMETVGQATNNKKYQKVGESVLRNKKEIDKIIEDEPPFSTAVGYLIVTLLQDIHDNSDIAGYENVQTLNYFVDDLYIRYLEKPTNKFLKKHGMPTISKPSEYGTAILLKINNGDK
ncbi:MAG: hypothetical protein IJ880_05195 [Bacilli bacterium]|nr:hypothetical protein [Bacilli bacterium]